MSRFESFKIGDRAELEHEVTSSDISQFVELTGDDNRLHTDAAYAATTSFKRPVVHGMLGAAFLSTVIGTRLPGDGALWYSQTLEFHLPVRVGDRLTVSVEVIGTDPRARTLELRTEIRNQAGQQVTTGIAKVKVIEPEAPAAADATGARSRIALVIGGSGAIGGAVCRALARDGFDVAVHYASNRQPAKSVADGVTGMGRRAMTVEADITADGDVARMVAEVTARLGRIGVLVNCASAPYRPAKFDDLTWDHFAAQLGTGVQGLYHLLRHVVPAMTQAREGVIIQLTSLVADVPANDVAAYTTAKAAVAGLCRAMALDLAPRGIRVNMVAPGMTDTDLIADVPERTRLLVAARTPLGRLARPEDVAGAVSYLASDAAAYLTGETLRVNGGHFMA